MWWRHKKMKENYWFFSEIKIWKTKVNTSLWGSAYGLFAHVEDEILTILCKIPQSLSDRIERFWGFQFSSFSSEPHLRLNAHFDWAIVARICCDLNHFHINLALCLEQFRATHFLLRVQWFVNLPKSFFFFAFYQSSSSKCLMCPLHSLWQIGTTSISSWTDELIVHLQLFQRYIVLAVCPINDLFETPICLGETFTK